MLFISYKVHPDKSVGAKRVSYWCQHLKRISPNYDVSVISSYQQESLSGVDNYYYLPEAAAPKGLIKDLGVTWKRGIKTLVEDNKLSFDIVLITGSPFMHFSLVSYFKKKGAKVVLDYRDPFAINPRFNNSAIKKAIKSFYEKRFNKLADKILTVNNFCLSLLCGFKDYPEKFSVIQNGYEEVVKDEDFELKKSGINLLYAGTFFPDRNPKNLFAAIKDNSDFSFHHVGRQSDFTSGTAVNQYGFLSYSETITAIGQADVGMIFSSGLAFESTTKIYDYIYQKKVIWVISNQAITEGALWEDLKHYPAVVWTVNTEGKIAQDLKKVQALVGTSVEFNAEQFSREHGLWQLLEIFKKL